MTSRRSVAVRVCVAVVVGIGLPLLVAVVFASLATEEDSTSGTVSLTPAGTTVKAKGKPVTYTASCTCDDGCDVSFFDPGDAAADWDFLEDDRQVVDVEDPFPTRRASGTAEETGVHPIGARCPDTGDHGEPTATLIIVEVTIDKPAGSSPDFSKENFTETTPYRYDYQWIMPSAPGYVRQDDLVYGTIEPEPFCYDPGQGGGYVFDYVWEVDKGRLYPTTDVTQDDDQVVIGSNGARFEPDQTGDVSLELAANEEGLGAETRTLEVHLDDLARDVANFRDENSCGVGEQGLELPRGDTMPADVRLACATALTHAHEGYKGNAENLWTALWGSGGWVGHHPTDNSGLSLANFEAEAAAVLAVGAKIRLGVKPPGGDFSSRHYATIMDAGTTKTYQADAGTDEFHHKTVRSFINYHNQKVPNSAINIDNAWVKIIVPPGAQAPTGKVDPPE